MEEVSALNNENIRYRFRFNKGEEVKFIGHLDVMIAFQRALKRADIPIAYSNGFNPHQLIAFALPLSLGYTSTGEYGDFQLQYEMDCDELKERLNNTLPCGMYVTELIRLKDGVKNTMASVCAASYDIKFDESITPDDINNNLKGFLALNEIVVMKKTKNNFKETDIKPDIINVENISEKNAALRVLVNAGSKRNLKPESVAEGFCNYINKEYNRYKMSFNRNNMLMKDKYGQLVSLTDGVGLN